MIKKTGPNELIFITDEDIKDPEFIVKMTLKNDLDALTDSPEFLRAVDAKLSHIYTVLDLFLSGDTEAINRIERAQQNVYDTTFTELLAQNESVVQA